jgi:3-mercaptopyruvate sulfurtransferase SseA
MIRITKLLTLILALALFVGCSSDSSNTDEAKELRSYMTANGMDLNNVLTSWITDASAIKDNLGDYNIIDIRSADDYNAGHVAGAVNSTLANIVTTAASFTDTDKDYIIICYTGQSAGHGQCCPAFEWLLRHQYEMGHERLGSHMGSLVCQSG